MLENIVIPYNDKCDEKLYQLFRESALFWEQTSGRFKHKALVDFAQNRIIYWLTVRNSYQCYYTLRQINHLAERFATRYREGHENLYNY